MARGPRLVEPGGIYHLTARGNRRQAIFRDDHDRRIFLALLNRVEMESLPAMSGV